MKIVECIILYMQSFDVKCVMYFFLYVCGFAYLFVFVPNMKKIDKI